MRWVLVVTVLATNALAECPADTLCALPLISVPPSLGVAYSAARGVMVTTALTLGVRSGGATSWLLLADVGLAWKPMEDPSTVAKFEPWLRFSMARLVRLSEHFELGAGGSLHVPDLDGRRLAGGATGVLLVRLESFSLRVSTAVELPLSLEPVLSFSVAVAPP